MRITEKGQVTIPQHIRERAGFMPGTDVEFVEEGDRIVVRKVEGKSKKPTRGEEIVTRLWGSATLNDMTSDEIFEMMRGPRDDLDRLERPARRRKSRSSVGRVVKRSSR